MSISDYVAIVEKAQTERDAALGRLYQATKLIDEGSDALARLIDVEADLDKWVRQAEENSGVAQRYALALEEIAAMDPKGIRADDLGRAARIATAALA